MLATKGVSVIECLCTKEFMLREADTVFDTSFTKEGVVHRTFINHCACNQSLAHFKYICRNNSICCLTPQLCESSAIARTRHTSKTSNRFVRLAPGAAPGS